MGALSLGVAACLRLPYAFPLVGNRAQATNKKSPERGFPRPGLTKPDDGVDDWLFGPPEVSESRCLRHLTLRPGFAASHGVPRHSEDTVPTL